MIAPRRTPACAIFRSVAHNGRPVVIVAGGSGLYSIAATHAEIWDFTIAGSSWVKSKLIHVFICQS